MADDADIVLTDTGSISRPTLVAFHDNSRLIGEEASHQITGESTISLFNLLIGQSSTQSIDVLNHFRIPISASSSGLSAEVTYGGKKVSFSITALLAMYILKLHQRAVTVYGNDIKLAFAIATPSNQSLIRADRQACQIAAIDLNRIVFVNTADCIISTYQRKLLAQRDKTSLEVCFHLCHCNPPTTIFYCF